jgi:dihydrofolate synthase/folylpolyglutamate synthase
LFFTKDEKMNKDNKNINNDNLDSILDKLFSLRRFGIKPGLERIRILLTKHGNPQNKFKSVHISGTNGKGSVSSMLASVLIEAGYNTGLYTSPHLVRFNERIQINGKMISDDDLKRLAAKYLQMVEDGDTTFFEITTAIAFYYFAENNVDIAVIETGMGGRYDATNVITPVLSVITAIAEDHSEYLGNSIEEIAGEKAGVIKKDIPVVVMNDEPEIKDVFVKKSNEVSAPLISASDYTLPKITKFTHSLNRVLELNINDESLTVHFKLPGQHQIENLRLVMAAADNLRKELEIRAPDIEAGVEYIRDNIFFRARMEFISKNPPVILDGAHNPASIKALKEAILNSKYKELKFNVLFATMSDKDIPAMLEELKSVAGRFVFTTPRNERAADGDYFNKIAKAANIEFTYYKDVIDAYIYANKLGEPLLICGSFYLAGEVLKYLEY